MKRRKEIVAFALVMLIIALSAFRKKQSPLFSIPAGWPKPVYNFRKNPLADKKIMLGRILFYDPVLSRDSTISCASCHSPYTAFTHVDHNLSHGIAGRIGNRNSPTLMNLAWGSRFMWDGAVAHLDEQALKPITNSAEMDETMEHVVSKLQRDHRYRSLFYSAFNDSSITGEHVMKALSQFMLTLVSANSKYDKVKRGEEHFTPQEVNGYALFQKNCSSCHTEPLFTNNEFENNGLTPDDSLRDAGQMKITHRAGDSLKFKVPTLRNIEFSSPYMHDGRFKTLNLVLNNYIRGLQHGPTLSPKLQKGIYLQPNEKVDLIAFLLTLTDKEFLFNPQFGYLSK